MNNYILYHPFEYWIDNARDVVGFSTEKAGNLNK